MLDGTGVGRISSDSVTTPVAYDHVRVGSGRTKQSQRPKSSIVIGLFFCFCFRFRQDRKRRSHKQNSASDSVGLIFTRSYHSTLLITTPSDYDSLASENQP